MFLKFEQEKKSVYINTDKIVSIYQDVDNKTMITTVNPSEFYQINQPIEEVLTTLRSRGLHIFSTIKNQ